MIDGIFLVWDLAYGAKVLRISSAQGIWVCAYFSNTPCFSIVHLL